MKVREILKEKGSTVHTVHQDQTLMAATDIFFSKKIGSLLVVDNDENIVGILSPNDILKAIHEGCTTENCALQRVSKVMTTRIVVACEDDDIDYVQAIMTENRVRHIPVFDKKELKGIVSIGDIVHALIKNHQVENHYLTEYISGKYPA